MSSEIKEPEEAVRIIMDALQFLQDVKVEAEWPIPVVRDRQGKATKDYTLKDWMLKCHEEDLEFFDVAVGYCGIDDKPSEMRELYPEERRRLVEEFCDAIHVRFSMVRQFGITIEEIEAGLHNSNVKARERGLID
jgi:hypothetical protein